MQTTETTPALINDEVDTAITPGLLEVERWLPVQDWPGYEVSSLGRVRSFRLHGKIGDFGRLLKATKNSSGYLFVSLSNGPIRKTFGVHRLVSMTFLGPRPPGLQCRHRDGHATNNRVSNLVWGTSRQNRADTIRHGTFVPLKGSRCHFSKLKESDMDTIFALHSSGMSCRKIAERFGVGGTCISRIVAGSRWKHIGIAK